MPSQEEADEMYKTGIALGLIKPPQPPAEGEISDLQTKIEKPKGEQRLAAARGSALRFDDLRAANTKRQREWCPDQTPDLSFRGNEMAGETGEACNVIKKLERERQGWRGSRATREQLAEELADVIIVADLIALETGIDLGEAVRAKFDATSQKYGLATRIAPNADISRRTVESK